MPLEARKSGIDLVGAIPWGTHFCHFYQTADDLLDIVVPFFKTGLENNEFCIWVLSEPLDKWKALEALRREVPHVDELVQAGRIEIRSYDEWYLAKGKFDSQLVVSRWKQQLAVALANGYSGIRAHANESWLTDNNWSEFAAYEHELNTALSNEPMVVLCTYPLTRCSGAAIFDVAGTHQFALVKRNGAWDVLESPRLRRVERELSDLSKHLEERVLERTLSLGTVNELLRTLAARVEAAREQEGMRIARELHDELGSALTSLRWDLEAIEEIAVKPEASPQLAAYANRITDMKSLIERTIVTVKRITSELGPRMLEDLGLVEALKWQAREFEARTGIACAFESSLEIPHINAEQSTAVFRTVQEALTNILRHAEATKARISIEDRQGTFVLRISDNGKGIPAATEWRSGSLGLWAMRERATLAGGTLDISGVNGEGTTITLKIPTLRSDSFE